MSDPYLATTESENGQHTDASAPNAVDDQSTQSALKKNNPNRLLRSPDVIEAAATCLSSQRFLLLS